MTNQATIVGLGEVLWDVFPDGAKFGGAPANFACSAAGLGRDAVQAFVVSGVGDDQLGRDALASLRQHDVDTRCIEQSSHITGQVLVQVDAEGKASYEFASDTAWDNLHWRDELQQLAAKADAVCFGTLGQRSACSRSTIHKFLNATREETLRIFDINLRPPFYSEEVIGDSLTLANVLKLNDDELPILANMFGFQGTDIELLKQLQRRFELHCVALTRGAEGAVLVRGDEVSETAGVETNVVDTVGAGDAYTAALALGLLSNLPLEKINQRAVRLAAYVCSQGGATPPIPPEL